MRREGRYRERRKNRNRKEEWRREGREGEEGECNKWWGKDNEGRK